MLENICRCKDKSKCKCCTKCNRFSYSFYDKKCLYCHADECLNPAKVKKERKSRSKVVDNIVYTRCTKCRADIIRGKTPNGSTITLDSTNSSAGTHAIENGLIRAASKNDQVRMEYHRCQSDTHAYELPGEDIPLFG